MSASLFISDLHLSEDEPDLLAVFKRFLKGPAAAARALYILGDLFEAWAGDDDLGEPLNAEVCAALKAASQQGVAIFFMAGNRDFLIGETFARHSGVVLLNEPTVIDIAGTPSFLMHGDTLCIDDLGYQAFRAQVRHPAWQAQFLSRDLLTRKQMIQQMREHSETAKQHKAMSIMDVHQGAVVHALRTHGVRRLIHGHTHRPAHHVFQIDGQDYERWVLSDWCRSPAYLSCDQQGVRAIEFKG